MNIRDAPEWQRYSELYRYFCVAGVRMEYKPYGFNQGATDIVSEELIVGSSPTNVALTSTTIKLAVDYTTRRANVPYKKYVGTVKARMRNTGGTVAISGATNRWLNVASLENYHNGFTQIISQHLGLAVGRAAGMIYVTYYIWFKGQRTDILD